MQPNEAQPQSSGVGASAAAVVTASMQCQCGVSFSLSTCMSEPQRGATRADVPCTCSVLPPDLQQAEEIAEEKNRAIAAARNADIR